MALKIKYSIIALGLMVSLNSCKKSWLDVNSDTTITSDSQFTSEGGFKDALMGIYINMGDQSLYAKDMTWNMVDIMAQQYASLASNSLYSAFQAYNYRTTISEPIVDANWKKAYNVIANINNILTNIEKNKSVLNNIEYSIIKGELLGLRAFVHFDLMRLYGYGNIANRGDLASKLAIPYVTEFSKNNVPQLSYAQTFEMLFKDINESAALLKEDPIFNNPAKPANYYDAVNRNGFYNNREQRFNYYATLALKARALQWQGGDTNLASAATVAEEVIKYASAKLITSTSQAVADPMMYSEHLFNLNVTNFYTIISKYLDANAATNINALYLENSRAQEVYETSNTSIGLADVRFNSMLTSLSRGFISNKYVEKTASLHKNTVALIKIPEMYYIAAEAYIKTNPSKAVEYLNKVRSSRGIINQIALTANATTLQAEIQKEYRKEFLMEGQLFFYYKRLGLTTFPGLSSSIVANDKIYLLPYPNDEVEFGNRVQ
jgi:hypothetical protein